MFGTLFDEDTVTDSTSQTPNYLQTETESVPPPRPNHSLCGLNNQGTTCYLNSLIQTLFFTPEFREAIFKLTREELGLEGEATSTSKVRVIIVELQRLFARMLWLDVSTTSTAALTESFGWVDKEAFQQHDAQELMRILFDAIHTSLVGTSCSTLISDLYGGSMVNKIICKACGNVSEKSAIYLDVNVPVSGYTNLIESLTSSFLVHETMEGMNQYLCNKCDRHVDATKETKIRSLPPVLVLSLMRLGYDTVKKQRFKETSRFEFPMDINMSPFCEKECSLDEAEYELFAVVSHSGSSYCGHYNVYIQDVASVGIWESPASTVHIIKPKRDDSIENKKETVQNYKPLDLLIYIISKFGPEGIHMDTLSNEISKEINSGWNKKFKKKYGSLNKFLRSNRDWFLFCEKTNVVRLKETNAYNTEQSNHRGIPDGFALGNNMKNSFDDSKSCNNSDTQNPKKHWFDLNDSTVTPVTIETIQMQYGGRGSAYMLFYRRKALQKLLNGEVKDCIPTHLAELIQFENEDLMNQRQAHEKAVNQILLFIHFGVNYVLENGSLQAKPEELNMTEISFDRRLSLHDLRDDIIVNFGELCGKQITMHKCKTLPSGLHLYEDLLKEYSELTLEQIGFVSGCHIFVWNGKDINGISVPLGEEYEPLLLRFVIEFDDGTVKDLSFAFPKNSTLSSILLAIGEQLKIFSQNLNIFSIFRGNELISLNGVTEDKTLQELELQDNDSLHLDISRCKPKTKINQIPSKIDTSITVKIENRCLGLSNLSDSWPVVEVKVDKTALLSELKALSISKLSLNGGKAYRLGVHNNILEFNIPFHEDKSVEDLGLILQSGLVLEEGRPPSEDEIVLSYGGDFGSGDSFNEVTINSDVTVRECLNLILQTTGIKGEWYLQRVNTFGDPAAILTKLDSTLVSEGIKHGDHLLVRKGHLVPYGYLSFAVVLFPTLLGKTQLPGKFWTWVMDKLYKHQNEDQKSGNQSLSACLGEVEISGEATLENLKQQILTLPMLAELELYSQPQHIRLRLINNGRPGQILRGHQTSLKKLKLADQSKLCVQIMASPEDLSFDTLVVEVVEKISGTNRYTDPVEVLWETRNGSLSCLRHAIANQLFLTENCLRLAKYLPEDYNWLVLAKDGQVPKNYKGFRRKYKPSVDLRKEPYAIKDGVRIALQVMKCQDINQDHNKDFSSEDDIINRQKLIEEKENKKKEMCLAKTRSRPPEVGIKIKVGDFS